MKKLIGFVGVAVIAMAIFFSTNTVNSANQDLDLANLLSINDANAECDSPKGSSANATCTASNRCRYDTTDRDCHL